MKREAIASLPEESLSASDLLCKYQEGMEDPEVLELFQKFIARPGVREAVRTLHRSDFSSQEPTLEMVPQLRTIIKDHLNVFFIEEYRKRIEEARVIKGLSLVEELLNRPEYSWFQAAIGDEIEVEVEGVGVRGATLESKSLRVVYGAPGSDTQTVHTLTRAYHFDDSDDSEALAPDPEGR